MDKIIKKEDKEAARKVFRKVKGLIKDFFSADPIPDRPSPRPSKVIAEPSDSPDVPALEAPPIIPPTPQITFQDLFEQFQKAQENHFKQSDQAQVILNHLHLENQKVRELELTPAFELPQNPPVEAEPEQEIIEVEEPIIDNEVLMADYLEERELSNQTYATPQLSILEEAEASKEIPQEWQESTLDTVQDTLDSFRIDAIVQQITCGPRIARIDIRPAPGIKVSDITGITNNFAMELHAESVRVLAPVPGMPYVGIEIPSPHSQPVALRSLLEDDSWKNHSGAIPLALGRNTSGDTVILDLARAPHLLIAGSTGSGKSVCINTILSSLLLRFSPAELELILVDPKVVELGVYATVPHLITPVINNPKHVSGTLKWVVEEMKRRYEVLAKVGARNIESFNNRKIKEDEAENTPKRYPFMVVIIDELADIMMCAGDEVETYLAQIAQLSRAVGIHTIIATQRPSVDVLTGIIKANYPTRIAFKVSSLIDSRVILDARGAETLLGRGDMLFRAPGGATNERLQGALVSDEEIESLVNECSSSMQADFSNGISQAIMQSGEATEDQEPDTSEEIEIDTNAELIDQAIEIIRRDRKASISYIQRRLRIGYNRAATIVEELEEKGILGPAKAGGKREILIN
jgi:DNA segregation ATPase FtsK/SpoIIIE, S-DNA-T family